MFFMLPFFETFSLILALQVEYDVRLTYKIYIRSNFSKKHKKTNT